MFEVVACRLVGENTRAISRNQATFSHSSPPGSTVRLADAKEVNQASRQASLHDSAIRESTRGFRQNDPLRGTRVALTMATGRKTWRDILIVRKTFAPETGSFPESLTTMAKKKRKNMRIGAESYISWDRIYSNTEYRRTRIKTLRLHRQDLNQCDDSSSKSVVSKGNLTAKVFARENCDVQIACNGYCRVVEKKWENILSIDIKNFSLNNNSQVKFL